MKLRSGRAHLAEKNSEFERALSELWQARRAELAARYASELSDGRLRLRLAHDEKLSTVRKRVQVRHPDDI